MKRRKRIGIGLLVLLVVSQLPFAYRRYRLGRLQAAILNLNSRRKEYEPTGAYRDYKGVIHVHSMLGGHSTGTFTDIIEAAEANHLNFVVMTEHPSRYIDTGEMTLSGFHGDVLFINGNEIRTSNQDRFLLVPGAGTAVIPEPSAAELMERKTAAGSLAFVAYPQAFHSWQLNNFDGIEVYNLYTNASRIRPLITFFDALWSLRSYANLLFTDFFHRPDENLSRWDETLRLQARRIVAIAGNDAHANIGFGLSDSSGKRTLYLQLDPYARSFGLVRTHVLLEKEKPLSADALLNALRSGHAYIAFDVLGEAAGFVFEADNGIAQKIMGDEIELEHGVRLSVSTPVNTLVRLIRDGEIMHEEHDTSAAEFRIDKKGVYRVEVYLDQLPLKNNLWIISNPIYIK